MIGGKTLQEMNNKLSKDTQRAIKKLKNFCLKLMFNYLAKI